MLRMKRWRNGVLVERYQSMFGKLHLVLQVSTVLQQKLSHFDEEAHDMPIPK